MKRLSKIIIFTICTIISITSYCYADDSTSHIYASISPSYIVIIPPSITLPYNNNFQPIDCHIDFSNVPLEEGYGLKVTMKHDNFTHMDGIYYEIPYETDFKETLTTETTRHISFKIHLDEYALTTSPSGKYNSKIIVTIEYIKL